MAELLLFAVNLLLIVAVVASGVCWFGILKRRSGMPLREKIESLFPARVRTRPMTTNLDGLALFITALIMMLTMAVSARLLSEWMIASGYMEPSVLAAETLIDADGDSSPAEEEVSVAPESSDSTESASSRIAAIGATSGAGLVALVVAIGWLGIFFRNPLKEVGLWFHRFDAWLGLKASLLILPPVLMVSALMALLIPYEHPVLESLAELATPKFIFLTFLGTAVVTPVVEEVLVRGLLQGGLQRLADPPTAESEDTWWPQTFWPVVATSFFFSLLHLGQGAAPIALFFLSLGLGYLYRQTGNLTAPIVVHMVLNGLTLSVELLKINA